MRKILIVFSCCIALLLVGFAGYRSYVVWRQGHWLSLAKDFAAKGDSRNELLCLNQVLNANPNNLEGCRLMATLAEKVHNPTAVIWRQRLVKLEPSSLEDRLALVQAALYFQDLDVASNALARVDEAGRKTAMFNSVAGTMALSQGLLKDAENYFNEAVRLDPTNAVPQMNLAVVRLHGSNTLDMAEARIALQRVILNAPSSTLAQQARRELIIDAMRHQDTATGLALSQELARQTNATFSDQMMRLNVLMDTRDSEFGPTLAACREKALRDPSVLGELMTWQINRFPPDRTLAWLDSLPESTRTNQPVPLYIADSLRLTQNWSGLQQTIQSENWGEAEFVRHAYMALALRQQGLDGAAQAEWDLARNAASPHTSQGSPVTEVNLRKLYFLATAWKWQSESEQILWMVVNQFPDDQSALGLLLRDLLTNGHTRSLMQLFSIEVRRNPNDLAAKNNLAMVAMLLGADELKPNDLAYEVYQKEPGNASYASTYAYALYRQGRTAEALKVLQQLKPNELKDPETAGYCGLVLKAAGDASNAKAYLSLAVKGQLLPEERKLFEDAAANL